MFMSSLHGVVFWASGLVSGKYPQTSTSKRSGSELSQGRAAQTCVCMCVCVCVCASGLGVVLVCLLTVMCVCVCVCVCAVVCVCAWTPTALGAQAWPGCLRDGVSRGFQLVGSPGQATVVCNNPLVSMSIYERGGAQRTFCESLTSANPDKVNSVEPSHWSSSSSSSFSLAHLLSLKGKPPLSNSQGQSLLGKWLGTHK